MKKLFAMILCLVMVLTLVACGAAEEATTTTTEATTEATTTEATTTEDTTEATEDTTEATEDIVIGSATDAVEVLKNVVAAYNTKYEGTDFQLPIMGGGYLNGNWDGPDVVLAEDTDFMTQTLLVPEGELANIQAAAAASHAMMINNFCAGAYNLTEGADVAAFAAAMQAAIQGNQWVCGFPEQLLIADAGECVVVVYGNSQLVENFGAVLGETYVSTAVLYNEPVAG